MNPRLLYDAKFNDPSDKIRGEAVASQLPGRQNGGAADAYRHILLAAELTRDYGVRSAFAALVRHEMKSENGADNGLDMWNNAIGLKIGQYVREQGGDWQDVVRLSRAAIASSFDGPGYDQVGKWNVKKADDGIRLAYDLHAQHWSGQDASFEEFAQILRLNRNYAFRVNDKTIVLEDGKLELFPVAMTSPSNWAKHPKVEVNGKEVELDVDASAFPTAEWFTGEGFVYEGTVAPPLSFNANQFPETKRGLKSGIRFDPPTPMPRAQAIKKVNTPKRDPAASGTEAGPGISNRDTRFEVTDDKRHPGLKPDAVAAQYKKLSDTMSDVGKANIGGRTAAQSEDGLPKDGKAAMKNGPSRTGTGNENAARQKARRLALRPGVQRLLSGDLSNLDLEKEQFSPNLLRQLMGGSAPRMKGAVRLEDIAKQPASRHGQQGLR